MSAFRMRMHPWLACVPISEGTLVPWIATRPSPPANSLRVSEKPVSGSTIGPRKPPGMLVSIRSAMANQRPWGVGVAGLPIARDAVITRLFAR